MSDTVAVPDPVLDPSAAQVQSTSKRELWLDRFRRFAAADQSVIDFCRAEGIATQAFYYWRNKLARPAAADGPAAQDPPRFLPVRLQVEAAPVELVLPSGVLLRLAPGCDIAFVRALLQALGAVPC
jgi:hypothetical protein